jgi:hypothetical protein
VEGGRGGRGRAGGVVADAGAVARGGGWWARRSSIRCRSSRTWRWRGRASAGTGCCCSRAGRGSHGVQVQATVSGRPAAGGARRSVRAARGVGRRVIGRPRCRSRCGGDGGECAGGDRGGDGRGRGCRCWSIWRGMGSAARRWPTRRSSCGGRRRWWPASWRCCWTRGTRPVRVVLTSCFSGGFAELAFAGADAGKRELAAGRCGLFAATAEREASGCDPNPDRAAQEGYGLHFLQALQGRDRAGAVAAIDLDGDGKVSLLEAHARARIASAGIDVPTSTSERWLRATPGAAGASGRERGGDGAAARGVGGDRGAGGAAGAGGARGGAAAGLLRAVEEDMAEVTGRIEAGERRRGRGVSAHGGGAAGALAGAGRRVAPGVRGDAGERADGDRGGAR